MGVLYPLLFFSLLLYLSIYLSISISISLYSFINLTRIHSVYLSIFLFRQRSGYKCVYSSNGPPIALQFVCLLSFSLILPSFSIYLSFPFTHTLNTFNRLFPSRPYPISSSFLSLLYHLLTLSPHHRLTATEAIFHPFFTRIPFARSTNKFQQETISVPTPEPTIVLSSVNPKP